MTPMPPEPQHAAPSARRDTAIIAAWAILIIAALASGTFNMVHAFEHSAGPAILPFLYGAVPPVLAALLAHVAAAHRSSWWIKSPVIAVTLASMSLSISSVASVAAPMGGRVMSLVFGLAVDAAAMTALVLILDNHRRKGVEESAVEQAQAAGRVADERARTAESRAREAVAEATARADEATGKAAATQAELEAVTGELATVRAELQGLKSGMNKRRSTPPRRSRRSPVNKDTGTPVNETGVNPDVDTQAEALTILAEDPEISGPELGRRLGVSKSYGCRLKRELTVAAPGPEGAQS